MIFHGNHREPLYISHRFCDFGFYVWPFIQIAFIILAIKGLISPVQALIPVAYWVLYSAVIILFLNIVMVEDAIGKRLSGIQIFGVLVFSAILSPILGPIFAFVTIYGNLVEKPDGDE